MASKQVWRSEGRELNKSRCLLFAILRKILFQITSMLSKDRLAQRESVHFVECDFNRPVFNAAEHQDFFMQNYISIS